MADDAAEAAADANEATSTAFGAAAAAVAAASAARPRRLRRAWGVAPSRISKLNTALQFLVVGCGLTSAAFALPPPPRAEDAAFLRWAWRGSEVARGGEHGGGSGAAEPAGKRVAAGDALPWPALLLAEPARLALPLLVVAVAATTLASGADYLVKAARLLSRFR